MNEAEITKEWELFEQVWKPDRLLKFIISKMPLTIKKRILDEKLDPNQAWNKQSYLTMAIRNMFNFSKFGWDESHGKEWRSTLIESTFHGWDIYLKKHWYQFLAMDQEQEEKRLELLEQQWQERRIKKRTTESVQKIPEDRRTTMAQADGMLHRRF